MPQWMVASSRSRLLPQGQTTVERSHVNELIAWVLKGEIDFRLGSEQRVRSQGNVVVIPGGTEHEAPFPGRAGMQAITLQQRTTRRLNSPSTPGQRIHPKRDLLRP